jgi:acetyl/propionyl-CoA carboxylase alpha subunit
VLVANRGEIAVRIIRAARDLGMETVAVYSDIDSDALHVRLADHSVRIGPAPPAESYLRADAMVDAALATGAEAVHPGYGFLAERAEFAVACDAAGLTFVGPSAATIAELGDKLAARRVADAAGIACVPGVGEALDLDRPDRLDRILDQAERVGFPLLVKASAGGGGRGMRRVDRPADLPVALSAAAAEAASAFGDGAIYLERLIDPARHIEVQLLGDRFGQVVAVGERDCSLQRRHQKLVEEAPAHGLTSDERRELHERAIRIGEAAALTNAATCEFLRDGDGRTWFLEVNTRLQVEHGVTELVSGLDIVVEQFRLAAGWPLSDAATRAAATADSPGSHAIEARLLAEDPSTSFNPSAGQVSAWSMPQGPGVRVDTAIEPGVAIPPTYDSLLAKICAHGPDRESAIDRLRRALDETTVAGVQTTLPFLRFVVRDKTFADGDVSTHWVEERWDGDAERERARSMAVRLAGALVRAGLPGPGPGQVTSPAGTTSGWRVAGREAAVDRWPG